MKYVITQPVLSDVYIDKAKPEKNFIHSRKLWMGYFCGDIEYRTLLKFDLFQIPSQINIISAKLKLYIDYSPDCYTAAYVTPYMIIGKWDHKTVTWHNAPCFDMETSGTTEAIRKPDWYCWDVTKIAEAWINGNYPNNGIMLLCKKNTFFDNKRSISSRDTGDCHSSLKPVLVLEYEPVSEMKSVILAGRNFAEKTLIVNTTDSFLHTPGFDTSQKSQLTFFIKNRGSNPATVVLEISPDNVDYMVDGKEIEVPPGSLGFAVPYIYAKYTRISYKSADAGKSTLLKVAFQAQV